MSRQPARINPSVKSAEGKIITFRDGPRLVPDYLQEFVTVDAHPELTFQEWVNQKINKQMEKRFVGRAFGLLRHRHFARS